MLYLELLRSAYLSIAHLLEQRLVFVGLCSLLVFRQVWIFQHLKTTNCILSFSFSFKVISGKLKLIRKYLKPESLAEDTLTPFRIFWDLRSIWPFSPKASTCFLLDIRNEPLLQCPEGNPRIDKVSSRPLICWNFNLTLKQIIAFVVAHLTEHLLLTIDTDTLSLPTFTISSWKT